MVQYPAVATKLWAGDGLSKPILYQYSFAGKLDWELSPVKTQGGSRGLYFGKHWGEIQQAA